MEHHLNLIAAVATGNNAIGFNGELLWKLPADMERFKTLTMGHPVIMGRKTWESIPEKYRPLRGRVNIVVTRDASYEAPGALIAQSFPEALSRAKEAEGSDEIFAIGGTQIYECALPFASRLYLTLVEGSPEADAFFPPYEDFTNELERSTHEENGVQYAFVTLERG